ncbi:MAG TPA: substrate-binding domain-containing protein [Tepidisphaeraceae bacterium]
MSFDPSDSIRENIPVAREGHEHDGQQQRRHRRVLLAMGLQSYERQRGIVRFAREAGWVMDSRLLSFHAIDREREYLNSSRYDGVLALMSRLAPWLPPLVRSLGVPTVDMWADYPQEQYPRVLLDQAAIGHVGAEHLLTRGFRELMFYTHTVEGRGVIRRDAFRQAVLAAGAQFRELIWDHDKPPVADQTRLMWLAKSLREVPVPFAVMAGNDQIASEVLEATELAGLRVPQDLAVLGVDDDPLVTELAPVPLSSIDSCRDAVGYEAASLLDRLMNGAPEPPEPILIPPGRVVTRRSTDVLAVSDREVADALQYIRERFAEPITVDDVAGSSLISRRQLQDRFLRDTGRTISQTILWHRINHAKKLLTETRGKIQAIAFQSGFKIGEHMSRVFRRSMGMSPQQFRDRYGGAAKG